MFALSLISEAAENWVSIKRPPPPEVGNSAPVALSGDGNTLVLGHTRRVSVYSIPRGAWRETIFNYPIVSLAASQDGLTLLAGDLYTDVFLSRDGGLNWSATPTFTHESAVACSSDGKVLLAAGRQRFDYIYISTNAGATWSSGGSPRVGWRGLACSADGKIMIAGAAEYSGGGVYVSTNSGSAWRWTSAPGGRYVSVAASADGRKLVAVPQTNPEVPQHLYTSIDGGESWVPRVVAAQYWDAVACSGDGTKLLLTGFTDGAASSVYLSTDSGATWNPTASANNFAHFQSVACSGDGNVMAAGDIGSAILSRIGAPAIYSQPQPQILMPGATATFSVQAAGTPPLTYTWTVDGTPLLSTDATLTVTNISLLGTGKKYAVTVHNGAGNAGSGDATLIVLPMMTVTRPADGLTATSVYLEGSATPKNFDAIGWFEWGAGPLLTNRTAPVVIPASFNSQDFYAQLSGLPMGVYRYRAVATNNLGLARGQELSFVIMPVSGSIEFGAYPYYGSAVWYEMGYNVVYPSTGMPRAGSTITHASKPNQRYTLPPDYTKNNAIVIDETLTAATVTLERPAAFTALSFLNAGSEVVTIQAVIHHADNTTETVSFDSIESFNSPSPAYRVDGRVTIAAPLTLGSFSTWLPEYVNKDNIRLHSTEINISGGSPVTSIDLTRLDGSGHAAIFAISGSTGGAFTPISFTGFNRDIVVEAAFNGRPEFRNLAPANGAFTALRALAGFQYEIQSKDTAGAANWQSFTNLLGAGADVPIIDARPPAPVRIYRAAAANSN